MPTQLYSKQDFLDTLQKQLKEGDVIIWTNELTGQFTGSKKNGLKVSHPYAPGIFKDEGVGHIFRKATIPIGFLIAKRDEMTDKALKILDQKQD